MNTNSYSTLFAAYQDASLSYAQLAAHSHISDRELAREPAYHTFLQSGMKIARLGGGEAVSAAIETLSTRYSDSRRTRADLRRFWAGLENWG